MEFLTKSGIYKSNTLNHKFSAHLEIYHLSEDEMRKIKEQVMPTTAIMELLGFRNSDYSGVWYLERSFVAYNDTTGLLVIEVRKSLNV